MKSDVFGRILSLSGLITLPGAFALSIWILSFPLLWIDHVYDSEFVILFGVASDLSFQTARALLSTIAAAAITTLSLVYSIVLLVFTLAAGTIAPRLLKRFTGDRVNQITAGILGGTFLFAMTVLYRIGPDSVPLLSITVAFALSVLFVLQLIYFVHSVSRSVSVDEEIASISRQLGHRITDIVSDEEKGDEPERPDDFPEDIPCTKSGYFTSLQEDVLLALAIENDLSIQLQQKLGGFVLEGQPVVKLTKKPRNPDAFEEMLMDGIVISPSRSDVAGIGYSVNLLVEIALRALSPGVNDTFTAIASLDRLTAAFAPAARLGLKTRNLSDDDGRVRLEIPGFSFLDMMNAVFHPLRQAAADNHFMLLHIANALARLHEIGNEQARELVAFHGQALLETAKAANPLETDLDALTTRLRFLEQGE